MSKPFQLVLAIQNALPPVRILQIPLYSFMEAGFKVFFGFPAEFVADLAGVDGVAQIMAGSVSDKGYQNFVTDWSFKL